MPTKQIRLNSIKTRKNSLYNSKTKNFSKTRKIIGGSKTVSRTSKKCLYRGKTMKGGGRVRAKFGTAVNAGFGKKVGSVNMFGHSKGAPFGATGPNPFGSGLVKNNPPYNKSTIQPHYNKALINPLYVAMKPNSTMTTFKKAMGKAMRNAGQSFKNMLSNKKTPISAKLTDNPFVNKKTANPLFKNGGVPYYFGTVGNQVNHTYQLGTADEGSVTYDLASQEKSPYHTFTGEDIKKTVFENPEYKSAVQGPVKYDLATSEPYYSFGAAAEGPAPKYDLASPKQSSYYDLASPGTDYDLGAALNQGTYYDLASSQTNPKSLYHTVFGKERKNTVFENPGYISAVQGPVTYTLATDHPDKVYQVPGQKKGAASSPVYAMAAGTPKVPAPVTYDLATSGPYYTLGADSSPVYAVGTASNNIVTYDSKTHKPIRKEDAEMKKKREEQDDKEIKYRLQEVFNSFTKKTEATEYVNEMEKMHPHINLNNLRQQLNNFDYLTIFPVEPTPQTPLKAPRFINPFINPQPTPPAPPQRKVTPPPTPQNTAPPNTAPPPSQTPKVTPPPTQQTPTNAALQTIPVNLMFNKSTESTNMTKSDITQKIDELENVPIDGTAHQMHVFSILAILQEALKQFPKQEQTPPTPKTAPPRNATPPLPLKAAPTPPKVTPPQTQQTPTKVTPLPEKVTKPTPKVTPTPPKVTPQKVTIPPPPKVTPLPTKAAPIEPPIAISGLNNTAFTGNLTQIKDYTGEQVYALAKKHETNPEKRLKLYLEIMQQIEDIKKETYITTKETPKNKQNKISSLQNQIKIISKIQPQEPREGFNKAATLSTLKQELESIKQLHLTSTEKKKQKIKQILQSYNMLNDTHSKLLETVIAKSKFSNLTEFNNEQTKVLKTEYLKALEELQRRRGLELHTNKYANNLFKKHMTERPSHH